MDSTHASSIQERFHRLYGDQGDRAARAVLQQLESCAGPNSTASSASESGVAEPAWDQRDIVLITYADQIRDTDKHPLVVLNDFLLDHDFNASINTVHLLPFFPYSSDDGFSVIDYGQVDPQVGTWDDVHRLGRSFHLMFDLVLNHISQQSHWFQGYLRGESPFDRFFIEVDPTADTSRVTRPRSLPLLTEFKTTRGNRHVWTTFSSDQIDLNFAEPMVLQQMIDVLLQYVRHGARIVRLDAVAYLWKRLDTPCIHLPETHEVVKLLRDVLQAASPQTLILTETNVPHAENVSYFGDGDEAQMVYQFSLPPLLLDAVVNEDATVISQWLAELAEPRHGTTYFNFTASHDGIGLRPLEGLISPARLEKLVQWVRMHDGLVSMRRQPDGSETPYELNIAYVDAMADPNGCLQTHARRFLGSQAVMLALRGIPGVYFHSLVGTQNDLEGVEETGQSRRINRRKFERSELDESLRKDGSLQQLVFNGYRRLLAKRVGHAAFHPEADQTVEDLDDHRLLSFRRRAIDDSAEVLVVWNVSSDSVDLTLPLPRRGTWRNDLVSGQEVGREVELKPFQARWIQANP